MVNEEIVTALRNAVDRGEPLEHAIQIMINSKYPPREVHEAANYVSTGVLPKLQARPDEELVMPTQKQGLFSEQAPQPSGEQPAENITVKEASEPVAQELKKIKPRKKSHLKEIILLLLLLILIGVLVGTILFREQILQLLS
jgi:hypothetical protein